MMARHFLLYAFASAMVGGIGNTAAQYWAASSSRCAREHGRLAGTSREAHRRMLIGNGEKLTVGLIIVIFVLTVKPAGLFGR